MILRNKGIQRLLGCFAFLMVGVFVYYTATRSTTVTHGFTMYYVYAKILLEGDGFHKVYDYEYFNAKVREYGIQDIDDMPNSIPTHSFVLAPVAFHSPVKAMSAVIPTTSFRTVTSA